MGNGEQEYGRCPHGCGKKECRCVTEKVLVDEGNQEYSDEASDGRNQFFRVTEIAFLNAKEMRPLPKVLGEYHPLFQYLSNN